MVLEGEEGRREEDGLLPASAGSRSMVAENGSHQRKEEARKEECGGNGC